MSIYNKTFRFAATLFLSTSLFGAAAMAAAPAVTPAKATAVNAPSSSIDKADKNTVLATVNDQKITLGDVLDARQLLPPQLAQVPTNVLLPMIVNQLVDQKAVLQMAEKANLENTPEVKKQMDMAKQSILQGAYLMNQVKPMVTDAAIKKFYDENYANKPPVKVAHIRHILVKTQAEAEKIIKELKAGKKFADLAKKFSIDKATSAQNGGDLGWIKADELVPEFSKAAFAMKANSTSTTPVHSPFGWHVIQVLAYKNAPVPTLAEVMPNIRQKLVQQGVRKVIDDSIKQSTITKDNKAITDLSGNAAKMPAQ